MNPDKLDTAVTLKPCPFCGNDGSGPVEEALQICHSEPGVQGRHTWSVQCDKCTATMGYSDSEDEAVEAWNRRAASLPSTAVTITKEMVRAAHAAYFDGDNPSEVEAACMRGAIEAALAASLPSTGAGVVRGLPDDDEPKSWRELAEAVIMDFRRYADDETAARRFVSIEAYEERFALLAALEPVAVAVEPVAWMDATDRELHKIILGYQKRDMVLSGGRQAERAWNYSIPLYTAPLAVDQAMREALAGKLQKFICEDVLPSYDIASEVGLYDPELAEAITVFLESALKQEGSK